MRWEQGRGRIEALLRAGELERVAPNREHADRLISEAHRHLASAEALCEDDPVAAYAVMYDAARKSLWAILANQGLRPTSRGGHLAAYEAVLAQLEPPMGHRLRPFNRMRRLRREAEYPSPDTPAPAASDVRDDAIKVREVLDISSTVLDRMDPY